MSVAQQIGVIIEQMPERKQNLLFELVQSMISPDDLLSEEDIADILLARAELARGEYVKHEDVDWS